MGQNQDDGIEMQQNHVYETSLKVYEIETKQNQVYGMRAWREERQHDSINFHVATVHTFHMYVCTIPYQDTCII